MTAYKRPVFFDRDTKAFSELSADSGLDLGIVARSILADAALTVGSGTTDGSLVVKNASDVETIKLDGANQWVVVGAKDQGGTAYAQIEPTLLEMYDSFGNRAIQINGGGYDLTIGSPSDSGVRLANYDGDLSASALILGGNGNQSAVLLKTSSGDPAIKLDSATATATLGGALAGTVAVKNASGLTTVETSGQDSTLKMYAGTSGASYVTTWIEGGSIATGDWRPGNRVLTMSEGNGFALIDNFSGGGVTSATKYTKNTIELRSGANQNQFVVNGTNGTVTTYDGSGNATVSIDGHAGKISVKDASANTRVAIDRADPVGAPGAYRFRIIGDDGWGKVNLLTEGAGHGLVQLGNADDSDYLSLSAGNGGYLNFNGGLGKITGLDTAKIVGSFDAVNKAYVDSVAQGLAPKGACHVSSQGNLADLATTTEVDGHTLSVGERVLVRYQSNAVENGIYEFDGTGLVRTADMAAGAHAAGAFTFVQFGTNADQGWVCTADAPTDVVGTDALPWTQFSAAGVIEAGDGLQLIGTVMSAKLDGTTLAASAAGLKVLGLPSLFEIDGSAVSAAVTAANLGTLVDGAAGDAAALHSHSADAEYLPAAAGLAAGQAAIISAAGEAATAGTTTAGAYMIGVCESIASGSARIVRGGLAVGVLSGATAGDVYYVQADGTLSTALPSDGRVVMAGIAKSASDLHVQVRDFGSILAA